MASLGFIVQDTLVKKKNDKENIIKVLRNLNGIENRKAQFKTVLALIINGNEYLFEGIMLGKITHEKMGTNGFGYDPIFMPHGYSKTFAELTLEEKSKISHRALALNKMIKFINSI